MSESVEENPPPFHSIFTPPNLSDFQIGAGSGAPVSRRQDLPEEFEQSGINAIEFAKMAAINEAMVGGWRQKRRNARMQPAPQQH